MAMHGALVVLTGGSSHTNISASLKTPALKHMPRVGDRGAPRCALAFSAASRDPRAFFRRPRVPRAEEPPGTRGMSVTSRRDVVERPVEGLQMTAASNEMMANSANNG